MNWTRVSVVVDGEAAEAVAEVLHPFAHQGVSLEQTAGDLRPDEVKPELSDEITVSIYLAQDKDTPEVRRRIEEMLWHLGQLYPIPSPVFSTVREQDWADAWKSHYAPFRVGERLLICPAWDVPQAKPEDILVLMDPGMAFGTGLHPTTRMCLEFVQELTRPQMEVLDLGTGSGILSITAAKLGANSILAVDTDGVAVKAARKNCKLNQVSDCIEVAEGSLGDLGQGRQWDLLLVNILAPVILKLFEKDMARHIRPGGSIVLSGIIEEQAADVLAVMERNGVELVERRWIRDWVTIWGRRTGE